MTVTISRVYNTYGSAAEAVERLQASGVSRDDISVLASNADGWYKANGTAVNPSHDKDRDGRDDRSEGAAAGSGIGVVAGGAVGVLTGLGLLAIPGVGPIVAAGWLAATAAGAVTGAIAGGIIGALVESGVGKENAELYAESLRRGGAIVTARVADRDRQKYEAVLSNAAIDESRLAQSYRESGWTGYDPNAVPYSAQQVEAERGKYHP